MRIRIFEARRASTRRKDEQPAPPLTLAIELAANIARALGTVHRASAAKYGKGDPIKMVSPDSILIGRDASVCFVRFQFTDLIFRSSATGVGVLRGDRFRY